MQFGFSEMSEADARAVAAWRYEGEYAVYNQHPGDGEAIAGVLDRRSPHYAARDEHGALVGFFAFGTSAEVEDVGVPSHYGADQTITVGLGLRPDLTGQRLGLNFVNAGLDYARQAFHPRAFRLFVLRFNERAIRVYERAGFQRVRELHVRNVHGENTFLEMCREA
ncbi:MAG TPA: GNAT family N-acetyltransferase [Ktedonobacterales bacterium]|nr:GNAT family N-acetyltransferase [Ktedonobacterales bacterium]